MKYAIGSKVALKANVGIRGEVMARCEYAAQMSFGPMYLVAVPNGGYVWYGENELCYTENYIG